MLVARLVPRWDKRLMRSALAIVAVAAGFLNPPPESRPTMRWWWFGPSVTEAELEREMSAMKDAGIGGFEVQAPRSAPRTQ